jgi:type II secretory pathway component GspD/PulD (secretin)
VAHHCTRRGCRMITRIALLLTLLGGNNAFAQATSADTVRQDSIIIRLNDVDLRAAIQMLAQYLDRPVVVGQLNAAKVTVETPRPIRRADVLGLLRVTLESQSLELITDTVNLVYRVQAKATAAPPPVQQPITTLSDSTRRIELFVIRLKHARAADVAATINELYGRGKSGDRGPTRTLSQQLRQTQGGMDQLGREQSELEKEGRLSADAVIVSDPGTNSLLVRATRRDYDLVQAAVKEVDVRPLQALVEVLIAEVRNSQSYSLGVDVVLPERPLPKNPNVTVEGALTSAITGDGKLRVIGLGGITDLSTTLKIAASRGDVSVISRPIVVAANNEKAEILVGTQRPFVQISRSLPTDLASRDQVVQYREVGTKLSVRPTITSDGYVMLEVTQEVNAATNETAFNAPVISTRSVQTRLLLKDGQTVVIGGLSDRQRDVTQRGIPILSAIPLLGGFFGGASRNSNQTELYLFITPKVVRSDEDAKAITDPLRERAKKGGGQ